PTTPAGFAAKGVQGRPVTVVATVVADGHDRLGGRVRWRPVGAKRWQTAPLREESIGRWTGTFTPTELGAHQLVVDAWTDRYATWVHEVEVKVEAGVDVTVELEEGARILDALAADVAKVHRDEGVPAAEAKARAAQVTEAARQLRRTDAPLDARLAIALSEPVAAAVGPMPGPRRPSSPFPPPWLYRPLSALAAWYELFARSFGRFAGAATLLEYVADLGFDDVYLPPIHPIGISNRKGRNHTLIAE